MSTYHDILAGTSAAILSLIAEPVYAQSWETGGEQELGQSSWRIMTINGLDRDENPPEAAINLTARAATLTKRGNYSEAEGLLKKSLEITSQTLGTDHPQIAALLTKLGSLYAVQRRYAEAEYQLRLSLKINEKVFGPDHLEVAANLEALAFVLNKELRYGEAQRMQTRASEIWSKHRDDQILDRSEPPPG
jgi:tetratricopeptide (TPR) repeat protein